jgi:hypothetical protein
MEHFLSLWQSANHVVLVQVLVCRWAQYTNHRGQHLSDWRIDNLKFTRGALLQFKKYHPFREGWDHDHCEGCSVKFMESGGPEVLIEGYATEDNYRWICPTCFRELRAVMGWKLLAP